MECENLAGEWKITTSSGLYEELWPEYPRNERSEMEFGEMTTKDGATFLYSGRPEGNNVSCECMWILLDKEAKTSFIEWQPVSARIIVAHFKTNIRNTVMIQCYVPTEVAEDVERQEFYVQLRNTLKKQKKKDIIIVGGDLYAKVGQGNEGLEHVMGRHGL
jgi:exonuclease III